MPQVIAGAEPFYKAGDCGSFAPFRGLGPLPQRPAPTNPAAVEVQCQAIPPLNPIFQPVNFYE